MNYTDEPFPRTLAALSRLTPQQVQFCHQLQVCRTGLESYRRSYGENRSGCPRKAAAKIKASRAVREYLTAWRLESHIRDQIAREAQSESYRRYWGDPPFDKAAYIRSRLDEHRRETAGTLSAT